MPSNIDQSQSRLLQAPAEILHEVFSYILPAQFHLYLQDDKLRLSTCLEPDKNKRSSNSFQELKSYPYDGQERSHDKYHGPDYVWARRVKSSWGPHWMCEENIQMGNMSAMYLLLSCERIYMDVIHLLCGTVMNITDLETLNHVGEQLATISLNLVNGVPSVQDVPVVLQQGITHLSITLRLPLEFFEVVELRDGHHIANISEEVAQNVRHWMRFGITLGRISTLTKLRLWLDHSDTRSWSVVNERRLLSPLLAHLSNTSIHFAIILPKLHPLYQRESRHFTRECFGVRLHRTLRQRWYSDEISPGNTRVVHKPDFPILFDILEIIDGSFEAPELNPKDGILSTIDAMARAEKMERDIYEQGHNEEYVKAIVREVTVPKLCGLHII